MAIIFIAFHCFVSPGETDSRQIPSEIIMISISRRSSRIALSNKINTTPIMSPPSAKTNKRKLRSVSKSSPSNKKAKKVSTPLGLMKAGNTEATSLKVGNIIGRSGKGKKMNEHVDLGITAADRGADCISRKFFEVTQVSSGSITLKALKPNHASTIVSLSKKKDPTEFKRIAGERNIVLKEGDILRLRKKNQQCDFSYEFQVVPTVVTADSIDIPRRTLPPTTKATPVSAPESKLSAKKSAKRVPDDPNIIPGTDLKLFRPSFSMGHQVENFKIPLPFSTETSSVPAKRFASKNSTTPDVVEKDDSDDENETTPVVHTTLLNAYWKALNTSTPHIGASFLQTLLTTDQIPSLPLLQDLVKLLTFGPACADHAFYDGYRLQLALNYVEAVVEKDPATVIPHLAQAAANVTEDGSYYLRLVMDQLPVLAYCHGSSPSKQDLDDSLQLHLVSLKLLELLITNDAPGIYDTSSLGCIAQAMAYVWMTHGHYLFEKESLELADSVEQLMRQIVCILGHLEDFSEVSAVDALWNAMDSQLGPRSVKQNKRLLLHWVCSLEGASSSWKNLSQKLAKRSKIERDYKKVSKLC
jgi:hypothetical protein